MINCSWQLTFQSYLWLYPHAKMSSILLKVLLWFFVLIAFANGSFPGEADEVKQLPGVDFDLNYRHYSGYLKSLNNSLVHYWLFESQSGQSESDPVAVWLNGGPGCSSLFGAFGELGPIRMGLDGTLSPNNFTWTQKANLLFLETPVGTGFSYNSEYSYQSNDYLTAQINFVALQSFFEKFPQFVNNDFYITGESYAGVFIPFLSEQVLKNGFPKNFKGIAIGNGLLEPQNFETSKSRANFYYYHGLVDSIDDDVLVPVDINEYNILLNCDSSIYKSIKQTSNLPPCDNKQKLEQWLNQAIVKEAINIDPKWQGPWSSCNDQITGNGLDYPWPTYDMSAKIKLLLNNGIKVLIYNGDLDAVCDFIGDKWFAEKLGYRIISSYLPWYYDGYVAGLSKQFENNLTFTTIRGAGHMVPTDQPGPALEMFNRFVLANGQL